MSKVDDLAPPKQGASNARAVTGKVVGGFGKPTIPTSVASTVFHSAYRCYFENLF